MADGLGGLIAMLAAGAAALIGTTVVAVKKDSDNRRITEEDGVFKSKGRYYAYCPKCGKKCAKPQIVSESAFSNMNTAKFRCYDCNYDFEKRYDYTKLKG